MADNRVFANGRKLTLTVSTADAVQSSDYTAGNVVVAGSLVGVALTDMSSNQVTMDTQGVYSLTVFRPTTVGDGRVGSKVYWNSTAVGTTASSRVALASGTTAVPSTGSILVGIMLDSIAAANSSANTTGVRVKLVGAPVGAISAAAAT